MITRTVLPTLIIFLCLVVSQAFSDPLFPAPLPYDSGARASPAAISVFDELQREEALQLTLTTDLSALAEKQKSDEYQPAEISYEVPGTGMVSREVEVRVRGKYRRRVCDFPPLKLKFPEAALQNAGLSAEFRSLKLVTHCLDNEYEGNENVLKEYLAYQLYGMLTPNSYRVQLVRITYRDSEESFDAFERFGFIIEDTDEMAHRLGGEECNDCLNLSLGDIQQKDATLMAVFQFMIGNADWKIDMLRNLKMVTLPGQEGGILVPYDFDFSGMVDAGYARPNPDYPITSVRDRVFIGFPVEDPVMKWALNYTKFHRKQLLEYIDNFEPLSRKGRKDVADYISHFFRYLEKLNINKGNDLFSKITKAPLIYSYFPTGQNDWEEG